MPELRYVRAVNGAVRTDSVYELRMLDSRLTAELPACIRFTPNTYFLQRLSLVSWVLLPLWSLQVSSQPFES